VVCFAGVLSASQVCYLLRSYVVCFAGVLSASQLWALLLIISNTPRCLARFSPFQMANALLINYTPRCLARLDCICFAGVAAEVALDAVVVGEFGDFVFAVN